MLRLENVYRKWRDFYLESISFEVEEGEYFIILGPSGAGKTLLLEVIAGIFFPEKGKIYWNGEDITYLEPERRGFAYVPQNYGLFPHMSVYENIAYGLRLKKMTEKYISRKVREIADILGIGDLLNRKPKTLSGGEAQRVAIARSLVMNAKLLLLDEPFANLDPLTSSKLLSDFRNWRKDIDFTAVHVTHSFEEALSLGDKVGIMLDGQLAQVGSIREVFSKPKDERIASFLGFENIIEGMAQGEELKANGIYIKLPKSLYGKVRIAIRPEDVIISESPFKSSVRNIFEATISDIHDLGGILKITLKVENLTIKALITKSSALELGIAMGKKVFVGFKATAIHIFER
ncbi:MAG: tungstate ABC transporter ATP-binding protein WtpC [Synergistetes bacterium]|nr:tungstate ABC transporter ATP-binding protein WtpC [Synergistota bacterium]